jgi:DNA-binding transcriptional LysR family regulator
MLPQLLAFEACIRHGSVTRAAEELALAQPTVSCLIKKLSTTMGGPLTVSRDRRIVATALGAQVLELSREVMAALERFDSRRPHAAAKPSVPLESPLAEV